MPVLISDANVLIDMECGGLLDRMFELEHDFAVLDVLFEEELKDHHATLPERGLKTLSLDEEGVSRGERLVQEHSRTGASRMDLLSLALAIQEGVPLLTGDRRLRQVCDSIGHEVRGTLWLMEELVSSRILTVAQAAAGYEAMRAQLRRLPWIEVTAQLRRLSRV